MLGYEKDKFKKHKLNNISSELQRSEVVVRSSNREAEESLLGQLMYSASNGSKELDKVFSIIEDVTLPSEFDKHFYEEAHQKVYSAIYLNYLKQRPISPSFLAYGLSQESCFQDDALGTESYLEGLRRKACHEHQIEELSRQILDLSKKRQLVEMSYKLVSDVWVDNEAKSSEELVSWLEKSLADLVVYSDYSRESRTLLDIGASVLSKIAYNMANKHELTGLTTGYQQMDRILAGFQNSDLIIIAARPAMGKTSFALCLALNAAEYIRGKKEQFNKEPSIDPIEQNRVGAVGFISLEMSGEQLVSRLISMKSGVNSMKLRSGNLSESEMASVNLMTQNLQDLDVVIDDSAALSMVELRSRVRRMAVKNKLKLLFVDYLQLLHGNKRSSESNRVNEISEISRGLKQLAKELNIPVIAMSQLSREVEKREDKIPRLSDLRESGSIEQDADIVMFIHREEYYLRTREPKQLLDSEKNAKSELRVPLGENELNISLSGGEYQMRSEKRSFEDKHEDWEEQMNSAMNKAQIIIAKHRNGPNGEVELRFDHNTTAFVDPEKYNTEEEFYDSD